ncbi:MAG: alpha/beta hydrolase [Myxococcota bacterium]
MKKLILLALLFAGCVHSYAGQPPLEFHDIPYAGVSGAAWPEKTVALPGVAETYGMPKPPVVTYVELNPGGARTIVFLHGLGSYLKFWRYQLEAFSAAGYRVIALDMVGFGKSSKPSSFPYSMESMADVVWELLKTQDLQKPILIGHSMGGQVALSFSIRYPEDAAALVLTAPAGFERFSAKEKAWFTDAFSTTLVKSAAEPGIWGSVRRANFFRWTPEYEWLIEERVRLAQSKEFDQYAYAQVKSVHGLLETGFTRDNLGTIVAPTLIIHGDEDRLIPNPFLHGGESRPLMEFGAAGIKGSTLTTLESCGHMVQIDCHDEYNKAVLAWLDAHKTAAPAPKPKSSPAGEDPASTETQTQPE